MSRHTAPKKRLSCVPVAGVPVLGSGSYRGWIVGWLMTAALGSGSLVAADPRLSPARLPAAAIDTVVVRPAGWASALGAWKTYRQQQGHRIAELDADLDGEQIRQAISRLAAEQGLAPQYVVLAGDVSPQADLTVPTFYHASTAMSQFGGDPSIASDNPYGDLDGDHLPEIAVGRIPADSPEQLQAALERVIAFEQQADYSAWRRDVHVVAGVGGFGAVADSIIEMTTRRFLSDRIPGWSDISLTQASTKSHYCPDPWRFSDACIGRLNQGGMFWVYIGHGHVQTLDHLRIGEQWLPILTHEHVAAVDVGPRAPIAIFLACYTGAFDASQDSLAEQLVLSPCGPIAALAASRVSGPYGLAMLSDGLLASCFDQQTATLGEVVQHAKQRLLLPDEAAGDASRATQLQMISALAGALSPQGYDLAAERREHVWEMNLLGDPLLRLNHPGELQLHFEDRATAGSSLTVTGTSDMPGELSIELVRRREQVRHDLDQVGVGLETQAGRDAYQDRYLAANQRILVQRQLVLKGAGRFEVTLPIPADVPRGKYAIRAFQEGTAGWRVGYQELSIRPAD